MCIYWFGMAKTRLAGTSSLGGMVWPGNSREGAWALDRGVRLSKLGPWLDSWPPGVCIGIGCRSFVLFGGLAA